METRNITLSLPEGLLQEVKVLAARRQISVSALLAGMLREVIERETGYTLARRREMEILERGLDLGTGGEVRWSRDELHERR
jgi:metal-responsive CopG/Arc/MetJ family transcriptional regulator